MWLIFHPHTPKLVRAYLRQPIVLTRGVVLTLALVLGLLGSAGVILGGLAVKRVATDRSERSAQAREQLRREFESRIKQAQVDATEAKRLARLEQPSAADFARALARFRRALKTSPRLRRLVRQLGLRVPGAPASTSPGIPPERGSSRPPARRRRRRRAPPSRSPGIPPGAPAPSPAPPSSGPPSSGPPAGSGGGGTTTPSATTPSTTTTTPSVTVPSVTVPSVTVPVPPVCLPGVSIGSCR